MRVMATGLLHEELRQLDHNMASTIASEMQVNSKRQRRPSVRLGEIGDEPMPLVLQKLFKRRKTQPSSDNAARAPREYVHQMVDHVDSQADPMLASMARSKTPRVRALKQVAHASADENNMDNANGNELLPNEDLHEKLDAQATGQAGLFQPPRRVHVGLKKRTKRGKLARRKRVIASRSVVDATPAKSARLVEENHRENSESFAVDDVSNATVGAPCSGGNLEAVETVIHEFDYSVMEQKVNHDLDSLWKENDNGDHFKESEANGKVSSEGVDSKPQEVDEPKHESSPQVGAIIEVPNLEVVRDPQVDNKCDSDHIEAAQDYIVTKDKEELAQSVDHKDPVLDCEVAGWLEALNLGKYVYLFELHEVDRDVLPLLTVEDLREMGIVAVGTRRKIFAAIQALGPKDPTED
ncbi:hypothetical protein O6H91_07G072800 [Diphasiastrum complanatum]|uniref:Uncharacterized protein n=2 Tax=Diphasiastrum complanatum TaxID=34168 RepID=A0ACC2D6R6_DIPCM|nr:hypothetical protein O6H91_07G072800 [Diphasiastrum complanatum]KAJ7549875.1 hypothetical protein O6H91_07G072800 [Diphasiastrum complanatum]